MSTMDAGAWLVLVTLLSNGPYVMAWPAPTMAACERARDAVLEPARQSTFCAVERPKADFYGPSLPATIS